MDIFKDFPQFLRHERRLRGWTQEHLAKLADVRKSNISRIENNRQSPTLRTLGSLLRSLELDLSEFTRRYHAFQRELHRGENDGAATALRLDLEAYLETLPERISEVSFQTETHYVLLIPKP